MTVHHSVIMNHSQLNAHFPCYKILRYIKNLDMFRALLCSSSGGTIAWMLPLVSSHWNEWVFWCRITYICSLSLGFCMEKRDGTAQGCVIRLRVNFLTSQHIPLPPHPSPALYCRGSPRAFLEKHYRLRHHPKVVGDSMGWCRSL
jgi:hypothetical protein